MTSKYILLFFLFLFTSCATELDYRLPLNRMMTPETSGGGLKFHGKAKYVSTEKVTLGGIGDSVFGDSTVSTEKAIRDVHSIGVAGNLGVHERVDLYLDSTYDTNTMFGAKVQLLGKGFESRENGTFLLSIAGGFGSGDGNEGALEIDGSSANTGEMDVTSFEYMLSAGYRKDQKMMYYLTLYRSLHDIEASLKQNGVTLQNGSISGRAEMSAANVGVHMTNDEGNIFGQVEAGYGYAKYENSLKQHSISYALSIGIIH